jgi:hypothetical protein
LIDRETQVVIRTGREERQQPILDDEGTPFLYRRNEAHNLDRPCEHPEVKALFFAGTAPTGPVTEVGGDLRLLGWRRHKNRVKEVKLCSHSQHHEGRTDRTPSTDCTTVGQYMYLVSHEAKHWEKQT